MASVFDYIFNIDGNFSATLKKMIEKTGELITGTDKFKDHLKKLANTFAVWDMASNYVSKFHDALEGLSASGITLDRQLHDLSAVAGVTGESLKQIEGYARESAKAFGIDAGEAVEGYKLLLSQLSPELGKYPEALRAMGESIATTSKLMGGDGVAAAEVQEWPRLSRWPRLEITSQRCSLSRSASRKERKATRATQELRA